MCKETLKQLRALSNILDDMPVHELAELYNKVEHEDAGQYAKIENDLVGKGYFRNKLLINNVRCEELFNGVEFTSAPLAALARIEDVEIRPERYMPYNNVAYYDRLGTFTLYTFDDANDLTRVAN